jgi:hypothetical protein
VATVASARSAEEVVSAPDLPPERAEAACATGSNNARNKTERPNDQRWLRPHPTLAFLASLAAGLHSALFCFSCGLRSVDVGTVGTNNDR